MKRQHPVRKIIRQFKQANEPPETILSILVEAREKAAKENHWRLSELCAALAEDFCDMEVVFGRKRMAKIRQKQKQEERP